jgi:hypothetical protein
MKKLLKLSVIFNKAPQSDSCEKNELNPGEKKKKARKKNEKAKYKSFELYLVFLWNYFAFIFEALKFSYIYICMYIKIHTSIRISLHLISNNGLKNTRKSQNASIEHSFSTTTEEMPFHTGEKRTSL